MSLSITVVGGTRPPSPTTVGTIAPSPPAVTVARSICVTERLGKAEEPNSPAGKSGGVQLGVQPARNSDTRPFTSTAAPTAAAAGGAPPVNTNTPSELRASSSGCASWK
ncbi:MAG TPA: hypothetical protein VF056_09595 [Thermoleophilaceae bacterium]